MTLKELNKQIDDFKSTGKDPKKLVIGYKTFAILMENDQFPDKTEKDKEDQWSVITKGSKSKW